MLDVLDIIVQVVLSGTLDAQRKARVAVAAATMLGLVVIRTIAWITDGALVVIGCLALVAAGVTAFSVADIFKEHDRLSWLSIAAIGLGLGTITLPLEATLQQLELLPARPR